jgi:hypothetical protein
MQYVQRSEQADVIEMRRSCATRPKRSTSAGVSGRPSTGGASEGDRRTVGIPSASVVMHPP